jgi:hypothetical protein
MQPSRNDKTMTSALPTDIYGDHYTGIQTRASAAYAVCFGGEPRSAVAAELAAHGLPNRAKWLLDASWSELVALCEA